MKFKLTILCMAVSWVMAGQNKAIPEGDDNIKKPKNIILLIGDGTGLSQMSASQFFNSNPSNFERFPVVGLIKISASNSLITDSAAAATAFASGIKTTNGAVGVDPEAQPVETIVEQVSEKGMRTGVIATSSITHATPACFFAHVASRQFHEDIAQYLVDSDIDFFAGGGLEFFNNRADKKNLLAEFKEHGFVIDTLGLKKGILGKQGFLLARDAMPSMLEGRGTFLSDATTLGVQQLSRGEQGFFLMVEASQVDWGGHRNDAAYLVSELIDFDEAIGRALDFAIKDGETLILVTADHETGGFTLASDGDDYNKLKPTFSTDGHSATMIPVLAFGPGSELFGGIYENTEIYHKMMALLFD